MVLLLDTINTNGTGKLLLEKVKKVVPPAGFEEFKAFDALHRHLVNSNQDDDILVLRATSREEIILFKQVLELLNDFQIILILPDRNQETVFLGHLLHPRFLAYDDSNFDDLASVLKKMLQKKTRADLRRPAEVCSPSALGG